MRLIDLTGKRFGSWTVLGRAPTKEGSTRWKVRCDCGAEHERAGNSFTRGQSSCCVACRGKNTAEMNNNRRYGEIGQKFGRLRITKQMGFNENSHSSRVECECECGKIIVVSMGHLKFGHTKSCGCLNRDLLVERSTTHGRGNTPEYRIWCGMRRRCSPGGSDEQRKHYFDRGIRVCKEWLGAGGFEPFFSEIGERPTDAHTLDRIDNDQGYRPGNVRWATRLVQARNTRSNRLLTLRDKTQTVSEWEEETGLPISQRLHDGWSDVDAITRPMRKKRATGKTNKKLTDADVIEIHRRIKNGERPYAQMARDYGVSQSLISHIKRGKTRRHLGLEILE